MTATALKPQVNQETVFVERRGGGSDWPAGAERRRRTLRCKSCGSADFWRIPLRTGIIATIMKLRGRKPFQCRSCGWICYRPARRKTDNTVVALTPGEDRRMADRRQPEPMIDEVWRERRRSGD
jgi:hypothetical protein